jgi:hypothetical protein
VRSVPRTIEIPEGRVVSDDRSDEIHPRTDKPGGQQRPQTCPPRISLGRVVQIKKERTCKQEQRQQSVQNKAPVVDEYDGMQRPRMDGRNQWRAAERITVSSIVPTTVGSFIHLALINPKTAARLTTMAIRASICRLYGWAIVIERRRSRQLPLADEKLTSRDRAYVSLPSEVCRCFQVQKEDSLNQTAILDAS